MNTRLLLALIFSALIGVEGASAAESSQQEKDPRALSNQEVANLHAFARLYGYLRFFHPSDQAVQTDWDAIAIDNVAKVRAARNSAELLDILRSIFLPIAPTVRIYPSGTPPPSEPSWLRPPQRHGLLVVRWDYRGINLDPDARWPQKLQYIEPLNELGNLDPANTFEADIGAGISVLVPTALYRDGAGTLPHSTAGDDTKAPDSGGLSGFTSSLRLADVVIAWNVFQHFYPYFDIVKVDWEAELDDALTQAELANNPFAFRDVLRRLVAKTRDGHGSVELTQGTEYRLPIALDWIEDQLVITAVVAGQNAVARGDVIERINGEDARDLVEKEEALAPAATPRWKRIKALDLVNRRDDGSPVSLDIRNEAGQVERVAVTPTPISSSNNSFPTSSTQRIPAVRELKTATAYVDLSRLSEQEWNDALPSLARDKVIIFDCRNYIGGLGWNYWEAVLSHLTSRPILSQQMYLPEITKPDRQDVLNDARHVLAAHSSPSLPELRGQATITPKSPYLPAKLVFLTGNATVSADENFLAVPDFYHLGTFIGTPTAGINGTTNLVPLPGGYSMTYTAIQVLRQDGTPFFGVGIKPNIDTWRTVAGVRSGQDEVLEAAIRAADGSVEVVTH